MLTGNDVLFVPHSKGKIAARVAAETVIRTASGIAILAGGR
jgi:hypothetical protein